MRGLFLMLTLVAIDPAAAQVQSRPTDPPLVTAANESWYLLREPIQFAGELYYPAGAAVFFNGNRMVRSGHYNGVPLYTDTTVEPYSILLVPITRGLMQPYERLRQGALAGTTGSRPPSFPVQPRPDTVPPSMAATAPTGVPLPPGAISVLTPEQRLALPPAVIAATPQRRDVVGTAGVMFPQPAERRAVVSVRVPENNDGIWIRFGGEKWVSAGPAIPLSNAFARVGDHAGFSVYARRELDEDVIYVATGRGLIAPYRLQE